jgi:hypothetical protein
MRTSDWIELAVIGASSPILYLSTPGLNWTLSYGTLLCYAAALILGHGLLRDLAIIARRRLRGEPKAAGAPMKCLCAESSLGLLVIAIGSLTLLSGVEKTLVFTRLALSLTVLGVMLLGFLIKDYVVLIRKEEDHQNLIIW